jgi:hypothetical protein
VVVHRWNSELGENGNGHEGLDWFRPLESKPYVQFGIGIMWREICPQGGRPRSPYIGLRPWATSRFPSILVGYNRESLSELVYLVLYSKLSSCPRAHMSGRAGPTDRSAGLLVGRACLSGTAKTLVGGDQGVPMSLKPSIDV